MSIKISGYDFEGPYTDVNKLQDRSGVYTILCHRDDKYYVIDVGESSEVKTRISNHDRKDCWKRECKQTIMVAVYYTPNLQQAGRKQIEQKIRGEFKNLCGE